MIESIGPIAINIVRVIKDVLTTLITYFLLLFGFTFGFLAVLYYYVDSRHEFELGKTKGSTGEMRQEEGLWKVGRKIMLQLVWTTFNPGAIPWEKINVINDSVTYPSQWPNKTETESIFGESGFYSRLANGFVIGFEIIVVIILINVLIAIMNNTGIQN